MLDRWLDRQLDRPGAGQMAGQTGWAVCHTQRKRRVGLETVVFSSDVFRGPTCLVVPSWVLKEPVSIRLHAGNTFVLRCVCAIRAPEHTHLIS